MFLSAEAAELLGQMTTYSKQSQSELVSDAIERLACNYTYWDVDRPSSEWGAREDDYFSDWDWPKNETFGFRHGREVPPWFVEQERLEAARARQFEREYAKEEDGLAVYRRGVQRNK